MPANVFVFVPAFGQQISSATFMTICNLQQTLAQKGIGGGVSTLSFPDIGELRNMALTMWYDALPQFSHFLFVDADMAFAPDLIIDMLLFDQPMVGACYPKKILPPQWTPSGTGEPQAEVRAGFMRVEGIGMGCTLIRRDMVSVMLDHMPELVDDRIVGHPARTMIEEGGAKRIIRAFDSIDIVDRGKLSEDLAFCIRWGRCGGQVWANIAHRVSHVGSYDYGKSYMEWMQEQAMQAQAQQQMSALVAAAAVKDGTNVLQFPSGNAANTAHVQESAQPALPAAE
jgi:hypothetical protein